MYTPNSFGVLFFSIWPLIIYWLFKKFTTKQAIFLSIAVPSLLLPAAYEVDYPLLPPLDRHTLTSLALMGILFIRKQKNQIIKPGVWSSFFVGYLLVIAISTLMNQDPLVSGGIDLPGSKPYDVISNIILFVLAFMPFFFGRNFFNELQDTEFMFKALTILALIYSVLMLYELKWSPHLHETVYGYFPGNFIQQIRGDGFRPVVFVGHGLGLAFWFAISTIAAMALHKAKVGLPKFFGFKVSGFKMIIYLAVVLVLCKTASAVIYLIFAAMLMYFLKLKKQILLSFMVTLVVMIYPINAATQFVSYSDVLSFVGQYSEERESSLKTRFENELRLTKKALERPYFGWSGWGRGRVYRNGEDITVTDGLWVITFGNYGAIGFTVYYLILLYPILLAMKSYRYIDNEKHRNYFAALAIILAIGIFDSVPNTGMLPVHLLLGGALLGQSEFLIKRHQQLRRNGSLES